MDDVYARLDDALMQYADDEGASVLGVSELDGFFHAIACAPQLIMHSEWMPAIWGGAEFMPKWRTTKEAQDFHEDLMAHYNSVMQALARGECAPLFLEHDADGKSYTIVDEWCEGFVLGMFLWNEAGETAPDELLEPILFFTIDLDAPEATLLARQEASDEEVVLLQELIPQSVFGLRQHFGVGQALKAPRPGNKGSNKGKRK